jgi:hypothetical protein
MKISEFRTLSEQLADPNPFFRVLDEFESNLEVDEIDSTVSFILIYNDFVRATYTIDGGGNTIAAAELEFLFLNILPDEDLDEMSEEISEDIIKAMRQHAINYAYLIDNSDIISTNVERYVVETVKNIYDKKMSGALLRITVPIDEQPNICP